MNSAKLAACATKLLERRLEESLFVPPQIGKVGSNSVREARGNDGVKEAVVVAFGLERLHMCVCARARDRERGRERERVVSVCACVCVCVCTCVRLILLSIHELILLV